MIFMLCYVQNYAEKLFLSFSFILNLTTGNPTLGELNPLLFGKSGIELLVLTSQKGSQFLEQPKK